MATKKGLIFVTMLGLFLMSCVPDLVVESFEITGPVNCDVMHEKVTVPVRLVVRNIGKGDARSFNVMIEQTWDEKSFHSVCFRDPEHSDPDPSAPDWCYPFTNELLAPGSTVTFTGEVTAYYIQDGVSYLRAKADAGYCGVQPQDYCQIQEDNEDNNVSDWIAVTCP